jgi:hypothetical protein
MANKLLCPYCFNIFEDDGAMQLERHVKSKHNKEKQLHLYSFGMYEGSMAMKRC